MLAELKVGDFYTTDLGDTLLVLSEEAVLNVVTGDIYKGNFVGAAIYDKNIIARLGDKIRLTRQDQGRVLQEGCYTKCRKHVHDIGKWVIVVNGMGYSICSNTLKWKVERLSTSKTEQSTGVCPDCKGSGEYKGLFVVEPCQTCLN